MALGVCAGCGQAILSPSCLSNGGDEPCPVPSHGCPENCAGQTSSRVTSARPWALRWVDSNGWTPGASPPSFQMGPGEWRLLWVRARWSGEGSRVGGV